MTRRVRPTYFAALVLALLAFPGDAAAQFGNQTGNVAGTVGGACNSSMNDYAWPNTNGAILKCVSNVWTLVTTPATAAGSTGDVQFNSSNALAGSANLFWDNTNSRLAIGTSAAPLSKLDIYGGVAIGTGYAGITAAPTNGAIIQGNVGIGTATPGTNTLQVTETSQFTSNMTGPDGYLWDSAGLSASSFIVGAIPGNTINGEDAIEVRETVAAPIYIGIGNQSSGSSNNRGAGFALYNSTSNASTIFLTSSGVTTGNGASSLTINAGTGGVLALQTGGANGLVMNASNQDVGIGTASPINKMDVNGGVAIGTSYAGVSTAPSNGLLVQGSVGIGTTSPTTQFHVFNGGNGPGILTQAYLSGWESIRIQTPGGFWDNEVDYQGNFALTNGSGHTGFSIAYNVPNHAVSITSTGAVAIGTTAPGASALLAVNGGAVIGSYASGATAAPGNGLIVSGNVGIGSATPVSSLDLSQKTDALALPVGTTGQEPASPLSGMIRYNTTIGDLEAYIAGAWTSLTTGGATASITLGTSAATPNPASSYSATTGLFSGASGQLSVTSTGNEVARFTGTGVSIGTSYAATAAPSNGMIVQGNVGIGTTSPSSTLAVNGATTITSSSSNALAIGTNGASNPAFQVNTSGASSVTGLSVQSAAAGSGVTLQAISSGTNENLTIESKGAGVLGLQNTGSGTVQLSSALGSVSETLNGNQMAFNRSGGADNTTAAFFLVNPINGGSGITASTEATDVYFDLGATRTHATGALALQRDFRVTPTTHAFIGASTLSNAASFSVDSPPSAGTNATITNAHAIYIPTASMTTAIVNSYGLTVNATTGATNNYAAQFMGGNVGIGTASPNGSAALDVYSTTLGILPPRMTSTQEAAISSPATGLVVYNTTNNELESYTGSAWAAVNAYDIAIFMPSTPTGGAIVRVVSARTATYPANLTGSTCVAKEGATASTAITINKVHSGTSTSVGTVTFAASGSANQTCTFTATSAISLVSGDVIEFAFPSTPDATLGDIAITLEGTHQ
jgi:hypothetical protein